MIYGEERKTISFDRGLWLTDDLDAVPEGYCANLVNLSVVDSGSLEVRPNFIPVYNFPTAITTTLSNLLNIPPLYSGSADFASRTSYNWSTFDLQGSVATDPVVVAFEGESGSYSAFTITLDGTYYGTVPLAGAAGIPQAIAQYRDRYYVIEKTGSYGDVVCRYNWGGAYSLSRTVVATLASQPLIDLVAFRDRLFALKHNSSRVFYSDQAAVGGYPETWSTSQFFDLPDSGAKLKRAFVANDRLYLFTTNGLYYLYANGAPSNWQLVPVSTEIKIQSYDDVNYIGGVFFFTDRRSIFAYNGSSTITEIGKPIKSALRSRVADYAIPLETAVQHYNGPTSFKFFPYLDGFIFACYHFTYNASTLIYSKNKYYYFNGSSWSEVQFDDDLSGSNTGHYDLVGTYRNKTLKAFSTERYSLNDGFLELRYNGNTTAVRTSMCTIRHSNEDIDIDDRRTNFALFTRDLEVEVTSVARIKEIRLDFHNTLGQLHFSPYVDGIYSNTDSPTTAIDGMRKYRVPVERQRGNSVSIAISGSLTKTSATDQSVFMYPSFRLNRIIPIVNTDTRRIPDQTYAS